MKYRNLYNGSIFRLLGMLFLVSLALATSYTIGCGLFAVNLPGQSYNVISVLVAILAMSLMTSLTSFFVPALSGDKRRYSTISTLAGLSIASLTGLEILQILRPLPEQVYYASSLAAETAVVYTMISFLVGCLQVKGRWTIWPPALAAGLTALYGLAGFLGQNWLNLSSISALSAMVRESLLLGIPVFILGCFTFIKPLRLHQHSYRESFLLRLRHNGNNLNWTKALAATSVGSLAGLVMITLAHSHAGLIGTTSTTTLAPMTGLTFAWIGPLWIGMRELVDFNHQRYQSNLSSQLATASAKRFLGRHHREKAAWAASVGLRTSNFIIDHDPDSKLERNLPASMIQIRSEEIQRYVAELLGSTYLQYYAVDHRLHGIIDPETSIRPCIDALKLFSCLYLDAGPLIERRIKGLTSLLPIIDPALSHVLKAEHVSDLIKRNQWFFHFDYNWVDQNIVHTPSSTRYGVRIGPVTTDSRNAMMSYLSTRGGLGNFAWISSTARERLLQEAPILANIMEVNPIPAGEDGEELLVFTIRFEHLIPRLQRYFDLDTMRNILLDFDPSPESSRLLKLLHMQMAQASSNQAINYVLDSIASYPWRGFKEKDGALQVILRAYQKITDTGNGPDSPEWLLLCDHLLNAIEQVGYPSQIFHHAQQSKMALRDTKTLKSVALKSSHARFHEAWLLLANCDPRAFTPEQTLDMLSFIAGIAKKEHLIRLPLVQVKAIDAISTLGKAVATENLAQVGSTMEAMARWFPEAEVDPDICCQFLDAHEFLQNHHKAEIPISKEIVDTLDEYFLVLQAEKGPENPQITALMSRWQQFRPDADSVIDAA